jgi:hypothetical protein
LTLPHLSETLYRSLCRDIDPGAICPGGDPYAYVAGAIDAIADRLASDRDLCRCPTRRLFAEIRWCFPLSRQARVRALVAAWVEAVDAELLRLRRSGFDAAGRPLRCPVFTRQGRQCERAPRADNGYCPSHQHLVAEHEAEPEPEPEPAHAA